MKIHQVTHLFHPDQLAGAALYTDLSRYLRDRGHDVRVTTTFSYYPSLSFSPEDRRSAFRDEQFEGIPVRRVGMWLPKRHKGLWRLGPEVSYLAALTRHGEFDGWQPDVVLAACPMLAQVAWQRWLYAGRKIPRLIVVQDLMAHAATELGIVRSRGLGAVLRTFERWTLKSATRISTISEGMRRRIDEITGAAPECIVIPNWIHKELSEGVARGRGAVTQRRARTLFYSGNFGVKQGLPDFLQDLKEVRSDWTIRIHGGGPEADALASAVSGWGDWLQTGKLLEGDAYIDQLLSATACVVTQRKGVGANFLPSKLLPALAAGVPVLAVCDPHTPLGTEVREGGFGDVVPPGDREALRAVLSQWRDNPGLLSTYSGNALRRAHRYDRDTTCGNYERQLLDLAAGAREPLSTRSCSA